ncbi:1915_t:CDS:1, partial [Gigaspora rosea]
SQNEMIQHYAIGQRLQVEFDQISENQSEALNRSRGSSSLADTMM